jgi:DnaJ family protein C protein 8
MQEFFLEVREVDRDNEVNRILGAFKLNPFEQMGLRFDATHEEAKRQYRKVSLMIHPDKCKHPLATSAFEVLGNANQQLQDEEAVRELRHVLNLARGACLLCFLDFALCLVLSCKE